MVEYLNCPLLQHITQASKSVKQQTIPDELRKAYSIVCSVLFKLVEQGAHEPNGQVTEAQSKRLSLTANLIQSTTIIWELIQSGYYFVSVATTRQFMEVLARIIELRKNLSSTKGKSPKK